MKDKNNITTLDEILDEKYGKRGTKRREEWEQEFEAFQYGVSREDWEQSFKHMNTNRGDKLLIDDIFDDETFKEWK